MSHAHESTAQKKFENSEPNKMYAVKSYTGDNCCLTKKSDRLNKSQYCMGIHDSFHYLLVHSYVSE